MRRSLSAFVIAALGAAAAAVAADEPTQAAAAPGPEVVKQAAREIVAASRFCTLTTIGEDGLLQARVMDPFPPDADLVVWMGTHGATRKVAELRKDARATLSCFDPAGPGYATFAGRAELVTDPAERAKRFKPEWAPFYEGGAASPDYLLVKLVPRRLEVVSHVHGIANGPRAWRPEILNLP